MEKRTSGSGKNTIALREGDEVGLVIGRFTDIGIMVVINDTYEGMLYKDEVYRRLDVGDRVKGYIKKIRQDGKIDVTLRKGGFDDIEQARNEVLKKLRSGGGFLPLGDNSQPELIRDVLFMSKKIFKKAIGGLYKDGIIELKEDGIKLKRKADKIKRMGSFKF